MDINENTELIGIQTYAVKGAELNRLSEIPISEDGKYKLTDIFMGEDADGDTKISTVLKEVRTFIMETLGYQDLYLNSHKILLEVQQCLGKQIAALEALQSYTDSISGDDDTLISIPIELINNVKMYEPDSTLLDKAFGDLIGIVNIAQKISKAIDFNEGTFDIEYATSILEKKPKVRVRKKIKLN